MQCIVFKMYNIYLCWRITKKKAHAKPNETKRNCYLHCKFINLLQIQYENLM